MMAVTFDATVLQAIADLCRDVNARRTVLGAPEDLDTMDIHFHVLLSLLRTSTASIAKTLKHSWRYSDLDRARRQLHADVDAAFAHGLNHDGSDFITLTADDAL